MNRKTFFSLTIKTAKTFLHTTYIYGSCPFNWQLHCHYSNWNWRCATVFCFFFFSFLIYTYNSIVFILMDLVPDLINFHFINTDDQSITYLTKKQKKNRMTPTLLLSNTYFIFFSVSCLFIFFDLYLINLKNHNRSIWTISNDNRNSSQSFI